MARTDKKAGKTRATMMDVAEHAGVSQATVSLVLNGSLSAKLSEATRKRVKRAASEIGYQLPKRATSKKTEGAPRILFLADELTSDPWMALAFDGAQKKATELGYDAFLAAAPNPEAERAAIEQFAANGLAGIIYGTVLTRDVQPSEIVMQSRSVLLNCYDKRRLLHSVVPADLLGGRQATQQLIDAGRNRIALINGQKGIETSDERLKGYRRALSSNDIPFEPSLVKSGNWEPSSGYGLTKELLEVDNRPDAIFCANDLMAFGCYEALREAGLSVPQDVSVVGFDDRELAKNMHPPLTTMLLPHFEMGEIAAEIIAGLDRGHDTRPHQIKVECQLVDRESI